MMCLPCAGQVGSLQQGSHHVHQVHSGVPQTGGVLRSDSASSETQTHSPHVGWNHWQVYTITLLA